MDKHGKYRALVIRHAYLKGAAAWTVALASTVGFAAANCRLALVQAMEVAKSVVANLFETIPACLAKIIDIAGGGENNNGYQPSQALAQSRFNDITINGLVVHAIDLGVDTRVTPYYHSQIIPGPGAFFEIADKFDDYESAMRRKLQRKLEPTLLGEIPQAFPENLSGSG